MKQKPLLMEGGVLKYEREEIPPFYLSEFIKKYLNFLFFSEEQPLTLSSFYIYFHSQQPIL